MSSRLGKTWRSGEPFIWLTGGALALALLLVAGLIGLILYNGLGFFWPQSVARLTLADGKVMTGQVVEREPIPGKVGEYRIKIKVANRDLYGADFQWVDEGQVTRRDYPPDVAVVERTDWGLLIGGLAEVREGDAVLAKGPQAALAEARKRMPEAARLRAEIRDIETGEIGSINYAQEKLRLRAKGLERKGIIAGPEVEAIERELAALHARYTTQEARLNALRKQQGASLLVTADGGKEKVLPLAQVLDVYFPNAMGLPAKTWHYTTRVWEFVSDEPRESNTEGGRVPGHLRHRDDGGDHEHPGDPARGARRLLPARVREAGAVRERGPDRGEQPGRGALHRVRGVRGRLLHLLRRRHHRPALLRGCAPHARPTAPGASSGHR